MGGWRGGGKERGGRGELGRIAWWVSFLTQETKKRKMRKTICLFSSESGDNGRPLIRGLCGVSY